MERRFMKIPNKKRPKILHGKTIKIKTDCGNLFITLNNDDGELAETRFILGKSGNCVRSLLEHIGVLWSILLQNIDKDECAEQIKKHLLGVSCGSPFIYEEVKYSSCLDYIAKAILNEIAEKEKTPKETRETK